MTMTFTAATSGLFASVSEIGDSFGGSGVVASLAGDRLTIHWAADGISGPSQRASFDIGTVNRVPEPTMLALGSIALLGAAAVRRRSARG